MSAPAEGPVDQACRIATAICDLVTDVVAREGVPLDAAIAGVRWAGITLDVALSIRGRDRSNADDIVDDLLAAMVAAGREGEMKR